MDLGSGARNRTMSAKIPGMDAGVLISTFVDPSLGTEVLGSTSLDLSLASMDPNGPGPEL